MSSETPPQFSSTVALVLSCLGCAVGTGNIWRFPRIVANNAGQTGGLVFLIVWLCFLFLWSIPIIVIEYGTGRYTRRSTVVSFARILGKRYRWLGGWMFIVNLGIVCFYSVVLSWCVYYFFYTMAHSLPDSYNESRDLFLDMTDSGYPALIHFGCVVTVVLIISKSVKTLERVNMVVVPTFLLIVLVSFIYALTLSNASEGLTFLFSPEWSQLGEPRLWVDAIIQNAFDTGAGWGLFLVYAIYMPQTNGAVKMALSIPVTNNIVSLISSMTTLSTVFHIQISKNGVDPQMNLSQIVDILKDNGEANTGLTFVWMPTLYRQLSGGRALAVIFFFCLVFAGLSSMVAMMEFAIRTVEDFNVPRLYSLPAVAIFVFLGGLGSSLNMSVLVNQDFVWSFGLLLSGAALLFMVFLFRDQTFYKRRCMQLLAGAERFRVTAINEMSGPSKDWRLPVLWSILVTFVCPLELLGMFAWWMADQFTSDEVVWYKYEPESLVAAVSQWIVWLIIILVLNHFLPLAGRKQTSYAEISDSSDESRPSSPLLDTKPTPSDQSDDKQASPATAGLDEKAPILPGTHNQSSKETNGHLATSL